MAARCVPSGHDIGDQSCEVIHPILVRGDSAGATHGFVSGIVEASCDFTIGYPLDGRIRDALLLVQEEDWTQAIVTDGTIREGAWVTELTDLDDLAAWPPYLLHHQHRGGRHLRPRASPSGSRTSVVRTWKDCGLANLPFGAFVRNETWVAVSLIAGALPASSQMVCFEGELAKAEPKTMRYRILYPAALLVRRQRGLVLRLDRTWPWATDLAQAFVRLRAAIPDRPGPDARPESTAAGRDN